MKQVLVFVTHMISESIVNRFQKIAKGFLEYGDSYMLINCNHDGVNMREDNIYFCSNEDLNSLNYIPIGENIIPGNNHFLLLHFYYNNPQYNYYWNIEYDVDFNGDWSEFFSQFELMSEDLLSCHLKRYSSDPNWYWWNKLKGGDLGILPMSRRIRSFNPIYRISKRALSYVDLLLTRHNAGHHEVFIPTALYNAGFQIADIGGCGEFVNNKLKNRFYDNTPRPFGTVRHKPIISQKEIEKYTGKLLHPCKDLT